MCLCDLYRLCGRPCSRVNTLRREMWQWRERERGGGVKAQSVTRQLLHLTHYVFINASTRVTFAVESVLGTWARMAQNLSVALPELWRLAGICGCVRLARRLPVKSERAWAERCLEVLAWNEALLARMLLARLRRRRGVRGAFWCWRAGHTSIRDFWTY